MKENSQKDTIFVQIASYRDEQLIPTLDSIISNAQSPNNLKICVCWQHEKDEHHSLFTNWGMKIINTYNYKHWGNSYKVIDGDKNGVKFTIISVDCTLSLGACWARNLIQQFYKGEDYTLQLDSHHRFVENWDQQVIEMLESLKSVSQKPIITSYLPNFKPETFPEGCDNGPYQINFMKFADSGVLSPIPSIIPNWENLESPIKARFYSAHFTFADGVFAKEIQHDPELFFLGEEISIAVRAFTHGYDLYHPHKILAWHEYIREEKPKIWDGRKNENQNTVWPKREALSNARYHKLFNGELREDDPYGFGTVRTLHDYEKYAGIDFSRRLVQQYTLDQKNPPNPTVKDWKNSFSIKRFFSMNFTEDEIGELPDDISFFYFGILDENEKEIYRNDLDASDSLKSLKNVGEIRINGTFFHEKAPKTYCLWPHSKSKGWLTKMTKEKKTLKAEKQSHNIKISFEKDELGRIPEDIDFCFIGINDKENELIHRRDLLPDEFWEAIKDGRLEVNEEFSSEYEPYMCSVWPHSKEEGWLDLTSKKVSEAKQIQTQLVKKDTKASDKKIFVQIASYRDHRLVPTLRSALENADNPQNLVFGICWQKDENESLEEFECNPQVRYLSVHYTQSKGLGWARHKLESLYDGEDYVLQLDSHHVFAAGWDTMLLEDYNNAKKVSHNPIITTYLTPVDFEEMENNPTMQLNTIPALMVCDHFLDSGLLPGRVAWLPNHESYNRPVRRRTLSAHFLFADAKFLKDVPNDPNIYFGGESEETTLSLRAWTHGYDFFAPYRCYAWHDYSRKGRRKHWEDHGEKMNHSAKEINFHSTVKRVQQLFRQDGNTGEGIEPRYDIGTYRSVEEYTKFSGIDFKNKIVEPRADQTHNKYVLEPEPIIK